MNLPRDEPRNNYKSKNKFLRCQNDYKRKYLGVLLPLHRVAEIEYIRNKCQQLR